MGVALYAPRDDNPVLTMHIALVNCISTYDKSNYPHVQQIGGDATTISDH